MARFGGGPAFPVSGNSVSNDERLDAAVGRWLKVINADDLDDEGERALDAAQRAYDGDLLSFGENLPVSLHFLRQLIIELHVDSKRDPEDQIADWQVPMLLLCKAVEAGYALGFHEAQALANA